MIVLYILIGALIILFFAISGRHVYYCNQCNSYYDGLGRVSPFSIGNDFWGDKMCKFCKRLNKHLK